MSDFEHEDGTRWCAWDGCEERVPWRKRYCGPHGVMAASGVMPLPERFQHLRTKVEGVWRKGK